MIECSGLFRVVDSISVNIVDNFHLFFFCLLLLLLSSLVLLAVFVVQSMKLFLWLLLASFFVDFEHLKQFSLPFATFSCQHLGWR